MSTEAGAIHLPGIYALLIALSIASQAGIFFYLILLAGLIGGLPWNIAVFSVFFSLSPDSHFGLNTLFVTVGSFGTHDRGWAELFGFILTVSFFCLYISGTVLALAHDNRKRQRSLKSDKPKRQ